MNIEVGNLILVQQYGEDKAWYEVISVGINWVTCSNGHDDLFTVERSDVYGVTDEDSVLKE